MKRQHPVRASTGLCCSSSKRTCRSSSLVPIFVGEAEQSYPGGSAADYVVLPSKNSDDEDSNIFILDSDSGDGGDTSEEEADDSGLVAWNAENDSVNSNERGCGSKDSDDKLLEIRLNEIDRRNNAPAADSSSSSSSNRQAVNDVSITRLKSLGAEIIEVIARLELTEEERRRRQLALAHLNRMVRAWFGEEAKLQPFGSLATGLALPDSDFDLVLVVPSSGRQRRRFGRAESVQLLRALASRLRAQEPDLVRKVVFISHARVPIVKFVDARSGFQVDVSAAQNSGLHSTRLVQAVLARWPALRPLVLLAKQALRSASLNETYSGGVGAYLTFTLALAAVQAEVRSGRIPPAALAQPPAPELLARLLLAFLDLWGHRFNYFRTRVSLRDGGAFLEKTRHDPQRPFLLRLEDPFDPSLCLGQNSYRILEVRSLFARLHEALLSNSPTPLSTLLALGASSNK
jgi:DNA polymerase sigma